MIPIRFYRLIAMITGLMALLTGAIIGVSRNNQGYGCALLESPYSEQRLLVDVHNDVYYLTSSPQVQADDQTVSLRSKRDSPAEDTSTIFPSPDGKSAVYLKTQDDHWHLYVRSASRNDPMLISDSIARLADSLLFNVEWSPDSSKVAYWWAYTHKDDFGVALETANADGSSQQRLVTVNSRYLVIPFWFKGWSTDGVYLATQEVGNSKDHIDTISFWSVSGGNPVIVKLPVYRPKRLSGVLAETWSPQNHKLAFVYSNLSATGNSSTSELLVISPENGVEYEEPLETRSTSHSWSPSSTWLTWSPDNHFLAVTYLLNVSYGTYVADLLDKTTSDETSYEFTNLEDNSFSSEDFQPVVWGGTSLYFLEGSKQNQSIALKIYHADRKAYETVVDHLTNLTLRPVRQANAIAFSRFDPITNLLTIEEIYLSTGEHYQVPLSEELTASYFTFWPAPSLKPSVILLYNDTGWTLVFADGSTTQLHLPIQFSSDDFRDWTQCHS